MTPIHVSQPWQIDPRELSLRPFNATFDDYEALASVRNATLQSNTLPEDYHAATAQDMERYYYRSDFSLADNAWLMFHGANPVSAAVIYPTVIFTDRPPGNFDMYVVPDLWRHGIGSRLLAHMEVAALQRGHRVLETTVAGEDSRSTSFLHRHGFHVVSHSLHLVRENMDNLPQPLLPEGYTVHSLLALGEEPELYMETANRLGAYDASYTLIRPEELERTISNAGWEPEGVIFLFDNQERIVGVIRAGLSAQAAHRGYLHEIRLDPASRGKGLGAAMVAAALRHLADKGVTRTELDTAGENTAAQTLATRAGFRLARHWLHFLKPLGGTSET